MNQTAVIAALGLAGPLALFALMRNRQCPQPVNGVWNSGAVVAFAALMSAARAHGWQVNQANFPTFDWAHGAATPTGSSYRPSSSFLFDY
jgi:hypothetical protein